MIKLNYNHEIGEEIYIGNWSWQVNEIKGRYRIIERVSESEEPEDNFYILKGIDYPHRLISIDIKTMAYFTGEKMPTQPNTIYNSEEYLPEKSGEPYEIFYEDPEVEVESNGIGYCYLGWSGTFKDYKNIEASMPWGKWQGIEIKW